MQVFAGADGASGQIEARIPAVMPKVIAWRRDFHQHPELSNREERTARVVAEKLRALGLDEVRTGVGRHGVVALLRREHADTVEIAKMVLVGKVNKDIVLRLNRHGQPAVTS